MTVADEQIAWDALDEFIDRMHAADDAAEAAVDGTEDEYVAAGVAADTARAEYAAAFLAWQKLYRANHPGENIYGPNGDPT